MSALFYLSLVIAAFLFMEFVAWFSHKYIMHGFLWVLHKDHHIRDGRKLEKNDWFALIFASPSVITIVLGVQNNFNYLFFVGIGIALYGLAYFLFHDVYVHRRLKLFGNFSNPYLRAIVKAHSDHHKPRAKYNYGFLIAPAKYYREEYGQKPKI